MRSQYVSNQHVLRRWEPSPAGTSPTRSAIGHAPQDGGTRAVLIRDVMSREYLTVKRGQSLRDAVEAMLKEGQESVIITNEGEPDGLITRRSALIAAYKTDEPLSKVPVSGFASGFPTSVKPDATVLFAIGQLINADEEVLPVVEDLELVGVVTRENLLDEYTNLRNEAFDTIERRKEWEEQ